MEANIEMTWADADETQLDPAYNNITQSWVK